MKPPDNSRKVLTWVRDTGGNEYWQFDHYSEHGYHYRHGWCDARAWNQIVLFWKEEDPKPDYEEIIMEEKKRYVKIKSVSQKSSYIDIGTNINLLDLLDGSFAGEDEGYLISIIYMTEDEFIALPEFTGF